MNNDMIFEAIVRETAAKVINSLDKEAREVILIKAVSELLKKKDFGWHISDVLEDEAKTMVKDYIRAPEEGTWICPHCRKDITKAPKEVDVDGEMPNIPLSKLWRES